MTIYSKMAKKKTQVDNFGDGRDTEYTHIDTGHTGHLNLI